MTSSPDTLTRRVLLRTLGVGAAAAAVGTAGAGAFTAGPADAAVSSYGRGLRLQTLAALNVRAGATSSHKGLGTLAKGARVTATGSASNGWFRIAYQGKTGYVSNRFVKAVSLDTARYVSTRNGISLAYRFFFKANGTDLHHLPGGAVMISDLYAGTVAWRDTRLEARYGRRPGWVFVRTAGATGWVRTSALSRTQPRTTRWMGKTSASTVRRSANGRLPSSQLVAIPWDSGKNLIAGPSLNDLTRMNTAFKKKFGRNLEIDLTYRTRGTQEHLYRELGSYIAARPGTSNHGWGMAIDFPESAHYGFGGKYYTWLKANSWKYGWTHRKNLEQYTASGRLNPYREPWHFEYTR
ncbi:MAG: SH3 domain-containing protein [Arthrobacter sp.]|uniref:SH3 domain-containing protein n=1 Tax=Arthrobacter sp. TaxID=1667 RepID=UPI00348C4E06